MKRVALIVAVSILGIAATARADGRSCNDAHVEGQTLRNEGKLVRARDRFLGCASEACPSALRSDCNQWIAEIEASLPSIVVVARDRLGRDLSAVRVIIDGSEASKRVDGTALAIDPGPHALRFELEGAPPVEQRIVAHVGERDRQVAVAFDFPPGEKVLVSRPVPAWSVASLAVGVVGIGVGIAFLIKAQNDLDALDALGCKPLCNRDDAAAVDRGRAVGGIALGAGVVLIATGIVLYATRPTVTSPVRALATGRVSF